MGTEYYFEYDVEDKTAFEVGQAGDGYAALVECNAKLLKAVESLEIV